MAGFEEKYKLGINVIFFAFNETDLQYKETTEALTWIQHRRQVNVNNLIYVPSTLSSVHLAIQ